MSTCVRDGITEQNIPSDDLLLKEQLRDLLNILLMLR